MRKLRRAVLLCACALVLDACGGGSGGGGSVDVAAHPAAALRQAGNRTAKASAVHMSVSVGGANAKLMSGDGAFDFDNKLGRVKISTTLGINFELILTGEDVYMRNPSTTAGAKPWLALRGDADGAGPAGQFIAQLRGQVDPRQMLRNLDTLVKGGKLIGDARLRGEKVTHVRGRVDLSDETIAKAPESMRAQLRQSQERFGKEGYDVDAWLDDEGRVRRFQFVTGALGIGGESTVTMDLFDYDKDPKITLPKASDVEEAPTTTAPR